MSYNIIYYNKVIMRRYAFIFILIVMSTIILGGCTSDDDAISKTTMDFRIEYISETALQEVITIDFSKDDYATIEELNQDRYDVLSYLSNDTEDHLHIFDIIVKQDMSLDEKIRNEYINDHVVTYEAKYINNTHSVEFDVIYKSIEIRQMWYHFVQTGEVLSYKDEHFLDNHNEENTDPVLEEEGTWFNKSYVLTSSVYEYAFVPYPTFVANFVNARDNVVYTQTLITAYDDLKTNAIKEKVYDGGIVERTWIIDIDKALSADANEGQVVEYYVLRANRVSWYILALAISCVFIILLFIVAFIKFINKRRSN